MRVGPSCSDCRIRVQTTASCAGTTAGVVSVAEKARTTRQVCAGKTNASEPDSYGYRPGRSALDAVGTARKRCWDTDWVIDLDIRAFFDSIPHDLVERAVAHHTDLAWVRLYVGRWLRAPVERPDGTLMERTKGTPQGGVVSPLL